METYSVYALRVIGIDEFRYIGITKNKLSVRLRGHIKELRRNPYKINWIKKHKGNIEIVLIEGNIQGLKEANRLEQHYIKHYKSSCRLLNLTNGGDGTQGFTSWNKGKGCSYIDKILSNSPRSKKVYCYDLNGKFANEYRSVKHASQQTGIARASIVNIANKKIKYKQSKGFQFSWEKSVAIEAVQYDEDKRINSARAGKLKSAKKIKIMKGNEVLYFENYKEAAVYLGLKPISVSVYCSTKTENKHGRFGYA